jgi:hypothetical protein
MSSVRPRRSVLEMPGSNARALEKAQGLPADALILDLEDAVAPDAKELHAEHVPGREPLLASLQLWSRRAGSSRPSSRPAPKAGVS